MLSDSECFVHVTKGGKQHDKKSNQGRIRRTVQYFQKRAAVIAEGRLCPQRPQTVQKLVVIGGKRASSMSKNNSKPQAKQTPAFVQKPLLLPVKQNDDKLGIISRPAFGNGYERTTKTQKLVQDLAPVNTMWKRDVFSGLSDARYC